MSTNQPDPNAVEIQSHLQGGNTREEVIFKRTMPSDRVLVSVTVGGAQLSVFVTRDSLMRAAWAVHSYPGTPAELVQPETKEAK